MITSTAAAVSRMVLSQMLICPPRSPSCLFPSASKRVNVNKALVLDDPAWMKSVDFMGKFSVRRVSFFSISDKQILTQLFLHSTAIAGHHGTTDTKVLDASKIPTTYTKNPPGGRRLWSTQQDQINALTDHEGYPEDSTRPPTPDDATIDALTPQQILDDLAIALERFEENPNKYSNALEVIPSMEQIQQSLADKKPLTTNQVSPYNWPSGDNGGSGYRHGELASDTDSGNSGSGSTVESYTNSDTARHASLLRMQADWAVAFYGHVQSDRTADDPSTIFEIKCPTGPQPDGSSVSYFDGTAVTTTSSHVIVAEPSGISIKDAETGVVVGTGLEEAPTGTVFRSGDGYKIKEEGDTDSAGGRRIIEVEPSSANLAFKSEVQKVCQKYHGRLSQAVKEYVDKDGKHAATTP